MKRFLQWSKQEITAVWRRMAVISNDGFWIYSEGGTKKISEQIRYMR